MGTAPDKLSINLEINGVEGSWSEYLGIGCLICSIRMVELQGYYRQNDNLNNSISTPADPNYCQSSLGKLFHTHSQTVDTND